MVEEAIDGCGGQALGEDRVEAGRMQVGRDDQRPFLIDGIDQAIEGLGFIGTCRQQADVVDDDQLERTIRSTTLPVEASIRERAMWR